MVPMVAVPVDVEDLARDKRATIAAHHIALELHDAQNAGRPPDMVALQQWYQRWHHAIVRVATHGPDNDGTTLIVNGRDAVKGEDAGVEVKAKGN